MRLITLAIAAAPLLIAGCVDQEFFVRQNVTYDRYERDFVGCATRATQEVPTNTQVGWMPYVGVYSADTNAALRGKNFELCMRDRGYQKVKVPYCEGNKLKAATAQAKRPQGRGRKMTINKASCWVGKPDGSPFLYSGT